MSEEGSVRRSSRRTKGTNPLIEERERLEEEALKKKRPSSAAISTSSNGDIASQNSNHTKKQKKTTLPITEQKKNGKSLSNKDEQPKDSNNDDEKEEENEEEEVRCLPCGAHDLNFDDEDDTLGLMIACEKCNTWQHAFCMFGTKSKRSLPKKYLCNICDPNNVKYKDLKLKLTMDEYKRARFPKRSHDTEENANENDENEEEFKDDGAIDNNEDDYVSNDEKEPKQKKSKSNKQNGIKKQLPPQEVSNKTMNKTRLTIIDQFVTKFKAKISAELLENTDKTIDELSKLYATDLESSLYKLYPPNIETPDIMPVEYKNKCRTLLYNLEKTNLMDKIINFNFEFDKIVNLTSEEMMRDDFKEFAQEVKRHSIAQSVLVNNVDKVKIKRTHRGEEIVEEDYQFDDIATNLADQSRINEIEKLKEDKKLLQEAEENSNLMKETSTPSREGTPLESNSIDLLTSTNQSLQQQQRSEYDEQDYDLTENGEHNELTNDQELDDILNDSKTKQKDEEYDPTSHSNEPERDDEYDPTNPTNEPESDDEYDPLAVHNNKDTDTEEQGEALKWSGQLVFPSQSPSTTVTASFVASTATDDSMFHQMMKSHKMMLQSFGTSSDDQGIVIQGRLDQLRADSYLTQILATRDLYLFELKPQLTDSKNGNYQQHEIEFTRLFDYFNSRHKYGVITNKLDYVKDSYLITIDFNTVDFIHNRVPDVFKLFDRDFLRSRFMPSSDGSKNRMFIVLVASKELDFLLPI